MRSRTWRAAVAAAGLALVVAGCGAGGDDDEGGATAAPAAAEQSGQAAGPEQGGEQSPDGPDTSDIPDPVAEVNGTEISRDEFLSVFENQYKQMSMQAQMTGQPVDEAQLKKLTTDGLVGTELLTQEAEKRGIEVSDEEIKAELEEFAETNQVSADEFIAAMGEQGLDRDAVMEQIDKQLRVEKLITAEFGEFEVTDAEIEAAYERIGQQQAMAGGGAGESGGGGLPPLEQVRGEVSEQVRVQKEAGAMEELSQKLRADADVTVHL
ncbi:MULTISPECIES: SurA N-terminal domain-containing protein [Dietzia]|uniref:SurA N-terminal domain-containing protein n=1 Tax=Dietzia TaxID=37914 RepID=UPI0020C1D6D4|nr:MULTISPECIES: SurA N-terminal domain-containing protein [Dietzia]MCT1712227.1 SurA N-terminal domain-containing protein [Dietzia cinnamea]MCT2263897.1 SurA N-terminal domain-containing protein [Dietzia cinnamea]MCT2274704.1 SurA N-terminal domain-containing protein [Dietzia cinnamea]